VTAINDSVLVAYTSVDKPAPGIVNGLDRKRTSEASVVYFPPDGPVSAVTEWVHVAASSSEAQKWLEEQATDAVLDPPDDVLKWERVCWPATAAAAPAPAAPAPPPPPDMTK
jgi:hypothetical protein